MANKNIDPIKNQTSPDNQDKVRAHLKKLFSEQRRLAKGLHEKSIKVVIKDDSPSGVDWL